MGTLRLLGEVILIFVGIALGALAMILQFQELHSVVLDTALFAMGIALVSFRLLRRVVWMTFSMMVPWCALVALVVYLSITDRYRFEITPLMIGAATLPPFLAAVFLELLPPTPEEIFEEEHTPHLEIELDPTLAGRIPEDELPAADK